jgi:hypothetical protein
MIINGMKGRKDLNGVAVDARNDDGAGERVRAVVVETGERVHVWRTMLVSEQAYLRQCVDGMIVAVEEAHKRAVQARMQEEERAQEARIQAEERTKGTHKAGKNGRHTWHRGAFSTPKRRSGSRTSGQNGTQITKGGVANTKRKRRRTPCSPATSLPPGRGWRWHAPTHRA